MSFKYECDEVLEDTLNKHPRSRAERLRLDRKYSLYKLDNPLKYSLDEGAEYDPRGITNKTTKEAGDNREA